MSYPAVVGRWCECEHSQRKHDRRGGPCGGGLSHRDRFGKAGTRCTCETFRLESVVFDGIVGRHAIDCPCWRCEQGQVKFPSPETASEALASVALMNTVEGLHERIAECNAAFGRDQFEQRAIGQRELAALDWSPRRYRGGAS